MTNLFIKIIIFVSIFQLNNCNICDLCNCALKQHENQTNLTIIIVECKSTIKNNFKLELDNIQWPTNYHLIEAYFNDLKLSYLPKILGVPTVNLLNFDNNIIDSITNDPFQFTKNIESLSMANNYIRELSKDFLKSIKDLKYLNLSHNFLFDIDINMLSKLNKLIEIDLSYNHLKIVSNELLDVMRNIDTVNLQGNRIYEIKNNFEHIKLIRKLNLAENNFTLITSSTFQNFTNIEYINLSSNSLLNIEKDAFLPLKNLKILDLSYNKLHGLLLELPDSLEQLTLAGNNIYDWPITNLPLNINSLELQQNKLTSLFNHENIFSDNLTNLNVSHNKIDKISSKILMSNLTILDLSHNLFNDAPMNLNSQFPKLNTLILNYNPIEHLYFGKLNIRNLEINNMPILQIIDDDSFVGVNEENKTCMELSISNCPELTEIHSNSFENLNLCKLDLSHNQFITLPFNLTNWFTINDGINLQGNPFYCNCTTQWMLDIILKKLYNNENHQQYLNDLKCAEPEPFKGKRFVKYYRRTAAFCNPSEKMYLAAPEDKSSENNIEMAAFGHQIKIGAEGDYNILLTEGIGFIIAITVCSITLFLLIIFGVYCTLMKRRELATKNRRYQYY